MTLAQLYQLIDNNIRQNFSEDITGPIDNSVRHAIVDWVRGEVGDLSNLNTTDKSNVVSAINEVLTIIANNQSAQYDKYFGQAKVVNSPINSVSGQTDNYIIVNDSGTHYFGVKKSLGNDFEDVKLVFLSGLDKKILDTPDVSNLYYDFWNVGSISNLPQAGDYEFFNVWFIHKIGKYIKADGSVPFKGNQSMGGFKLTDLAQGMDADDAARRDELVKWNGMTW